ncbi:MAG: CcmD family protein [Candidatus Schekmanbacteria bacterium]|nr:CcmD family protein [Candidatus Schekmanbacteria bacterium]
MENLNYLFAAYCVIWTVIFGYMFVLSRRLKSIQAELDALKACEPGEGKSCKDTCACSG